MVITLIVHTPFQSKHGECMAQSDLNKKPIMKLDEVSLMRLRKRIKDGNKKHSGPIRLYMNISKPKETDTQ